MAEPVEADGAEGVWSPRVVAPALLLAAALLSLWYAGRSLPFQDEGATLTAAAKILRGGIFYRDIDAYPFPGAPYLLAGAMGLFGEHLSVARGLAGAFFCIWVVALYFVALRFLGPRRAALFGVGLLGFKFLGWPAFSVYLYSDLSFACAALAMAGLFGARGTRPDVRLFAVGVAVASAVAGKQNLGIYLGAACVAVLAPLPTPFRLSARASWRSVVVFVAGAAVPLVLATLWFAAHGLLGQLLYSGLIRPLTGYLPTSGIAFSPMLAWWEFGRVRGPDAVNYFPVDYLQLLGLGVLENDAWWWLGELFARIVYAGVVVAALAFVVFCLRSWRRSEMARDETDLGALGLVSLAVLFSAFPRADFFHIVSVVAPTCLFSWALALRALDATRAPRVAAALIGIFLLATTSLAVVHRSLFTHRLDVARANVSVLPQDAWLGSVVRGIENETDPSAAFFVHGHESHIYFLTGRFFPWPFSQLYPGQTGPGRGEEIAALLASDPPPLLIRGWQFWPGMPRVDEYAPEIDRFVRDNYLLDANFFGAYPPPEGARVPRPKEFAVLRLRPAGPAQR